MMGYLGAVGYAIVSMLIVGGVFKVCGINKDTVNKVFHVE
jgi:hypothetical protein